MVKNEDDIIKKTNHYLLILWLSCTLFILCAYTLEFIKGEKTQEGMLLYCFTGIVPYLLVWLYNRRCNGCGKNTALYAMFGYGLFYAVCLITATKPIVTIYYIPFIIYILLYDHVSYVIINCVIVMSINVTSILEWTLAKGRVGTYNFAQYSVQIALCVMIILTSYFFYKIIQRI